MKKIRINIFLKFKNRINSHFHFECIERWQIHFRKMKIQILVSKSGKVRQIYLSINFYPLPLLKELTWHRWTKMSQKWLSTRLLDKLDQNVSKLPLDQNVINISFDQNVSNFFLDQNVSMFWLDQSVSKLPLDQNVSNFSLDQNVSIFFLD